MGKEIYIKSRRPLPALPRSKRLREGGSPGGGYSSGATAGGASGTGLSEWEIRSLIINLCAARYLSKITEDEAAELINFAKGLTTGDYEAGRKGASIDSEGKGEMQTLIVRALARAAELAVGEYASGLSGAHIDGEGNAEVGNIWVRVLARLERLRVESDAEFWGQLSSKDFISGFVQGKGWAMMKTEVYNALGIPETKYTLEVDDLIVRNSIKAYEFVISQLLGENDNRVFTAMLDVHHYDASTGRVWLNTQGGKFYNPFRTGDYIMVQQYDGMPSSDNDNNVIKHYELVITDAGVGDLELGGDRLDWVTFKNFTSSAGYTPVQCIAEGDTFVRVDNEYSNDRKGMIQITSVGNDAPYIDVMHGLKTDPDNALKGRIGNLKGVHHHMFGWLQGFGEYLTNLYAVGDFRLKRTGESIDAQIEMLKNSFATRYGSLQYELTADDNHLFNASFLEMMKGWDKKDEGSIIKQNGEALLMNGNTYVSDGCRANVETLDGRPVLFIKNSCVKQDNSLIKPPGTHREYVLNFDGTTTDKYINKPDTLYLSLRCLVTKPGTLTIGFPDAKSRGFDSFDTPIIEHLDASQDVVTLRWKGTWDGMGDFLLQFDGEMYVYTLSLTDVPLENFKKEMSTKIEQTDEMISLTATDIDDVSAAVGQLNIRADKIDSCIANVTEDMESLSEQTAKGFEQTVRKGDILSVISQSADCVNVTANSIELAGENVNVIGNFYARTLGYMVNKSIDNEVIDGSFVHGGTTHDIMILPDVPDGRVTTIRFFLANSTNNKGIPFKIRVYNTSRDYIYDSITANGNSFLREITLYSNEGAYYEFVGVNISGTVMWYKILLSN